MTPEQFEEFNNLMNQLAKEFETEIKNNLAKPYKFGIGYLRKNPSGGQAPKIASRGLYDSVKVVWDPLNQTTNVIMLDYWRWVNQGRKNNSKFVPIQPLIQWIKQKGIQTDNPRSLAFAISRKIAKFGISQTNFYDDAAGTFVEKIYERVEEAYGADLERLTSAIIERELNTR